MSRQAVRRGWRGRVRRAVNASQRYAAWRGLLDFSVELALAGLRAQGFSKRRAWEIVCQRWARASQEHHEANLRLMRQSARRDRVSRSKRLGISKQLAATRRA